MSSLYHYVRLWRIGDQNQNGQSFIEGMQGKAQMVFARTGAEFTTPQGVNQDCFLEGHLSIAGQVLLREGVEAKVTSAGLLEWYAQFQEAVELARR